jgi:phage gpG-like protein
VPSGAVVDTSELDRELSAIERRVTDYSPITPVLAEILVGAVNDRWMSAGGGSWAPLAPSTLYKRRLHGKGAQILLDTGRAAASVQADSGPTWAQAATDVAYMVFHVSDGARSKIPLRDPFDVEEAAWPDLADALGTWLTEG